MAIFSALFDSFFYLAYYYGSIEATQKIENVKTNNIILTTLANISYMLGPMIAAGIILLTENQSYLFETSLTIFGLSLIPLFFYKLNHKVQKTKINFREFFKDVKNKKNYTSLALYKIVQGAESIIFPILIFLTFEKLDSVAYISVLSTIAIFLTTFISGSVAKPHREKIIIAGSFLLIFVWLGRIFSENEF
jgi:hypothetical protein